MAKVADVFSHIVSCVLCDREVDWRLFEGFSSDAWERLYGLSVKQGVVAVIFDKLKRLPQEVAPPKALLMKWLRHTLSVERKMVEKRDAAVDFSGLLSKRGIRT